MGEAVATTRVHAIPRTSLAVLAVPAAVLALLLAEALALPTAWLPLDEGAIVDRARGLPGAISGPLYPLLLAPLAHHASGRTLLAGARIFNALCWTAILVPAYRLA